MRLSVEVGEATDLCMVVVMVVAIAVDVDPAVAPVVMAMTTKCRGKTSHMTLCCYKRFDTSYNGDDKHANTATTDYNIDTD
jgi:hypothetical protein